MLNKHILNNETEMFDGKLLGIEAQRRRTLRKTALVPHAHVVVGTHTRTGDMRPCADGIQQFGGARGDRRDAQGNIVIGAMNRPRRRIGNCDFQFAGVPSASQESRSGKPRYAGTDDKDFVAPLHARGTPRDSRGSRPARPIVCFANTERTPGTRSKPSIPMSRRIRVGGPTRPNSLTSPSVNPTSFC